MVYSGGFTGKRITFFSGPSAVVEIGLHVDRGRRRQDYLLESLHKACVSFLFIIFLIFLFLEGKGRRGREMSMCGCLWCAPCWGPGLQPRYVP